MNVGPIASASILVPLGVLLLAAIWAARVSRRRALRRLGQRTALVRAEKLRHENRLEEARSLLLRAALDDPTDSAIHYRLACCHSLLGDSRNAMTSLKRACDLDTNWSVSAAHDPDLRRLWNSGISAHRALLSSSPRYGVPSKAA